MTEIFPSVPAEVHQEILLRARGLSKSYGGLRAVSDASLDLYAGEVVALLGQKITDRLRVFAPQCLAGEDNHTRVDVRGCDGSLLVGIIDDGAEFDVVNTLLVLVGRERDWERNSVSRPTT